MVNKKTNIIANHNINLDKKQNIVANKKLSTIASKLSILKKDQNDFTIKLTKLED